MTNHHINHIELYSEDVEKMKSFYGSAFNWTFGDFPKMNYTTFSSSKGGVGGGFNPVSPDNPAGTVLQYFHTDDLEDTKAKIKAAGGKMIMELLEIPTVGAMAVFSDPSGNSLALLQPEPDSMPG